MRKRIWDRICQHLQKWKNRISDIKEMRVEGFEVFNFGLMFCFFVYFCTEWFNGPYTLALRRAIPIEYWRLLTGGLAVLTLVGFLEENYRCRRIASSLAALFLWLLGVGSAYVWPHWFIGWLFCLISAIPTWLCSQFAVYTIQAKKRAPVISADEPAAEEPIIIERDTPIVKLPRRI